MGGANCSSNHKCAEEYKKEADITDAHLSELQKAKDIYHSMAARVLFNKEKLLKSVSSFSSASKNFDSYYAFLSSQINSRRPSVIVLKSILKANKENIPFSSVKASTRYPRSKSRQGKRLFNITNTYLYAESPLNGIFPKGEKFRQLASSTVRGTKKSPEPKIPPTNTRKQVKNFNSNFDIISLLPQNVQVIIVDYLISHYRTLLSVSAVWHSMVTSSLEWLFNPTENRLIEKMGKCFCFRNSFTQSCGWKGTRVDRVIQLELLKGFEGKTLCISYTYCFMSDRRNIYRTQYKIDCIAKRNKTYWIHQAENAAAKSKCAYTMNIVPICTGDVVEIAINYYTARGLIDPSSISWQAIEIEKTLHSEYNFLKPAAPNKESSTKHQVDLNRVCELETTGSEWYDSKYYPMHNRINLGHLLNCFTVDSTEFAWSDSKAFRVRLTACRSGYVRREVAGIALSVKEFGKECVSEAKRLGLMIDRASEVQLRVGDTLVLYVSKSQEE
eukprot:TRINITY_DN9406_c0_g4_i2.p1 TRINITY_DN9406_c0_g4~~TRINITY_DN9406_c0_g4_i2.p1  ORF type:complete len:500 (+),score=126.68 TRINITY_DN9406_c0_g4_i2:77-1576(+)